MKRLIAVLLALVLIVMPVSAQTGSFFDYTDDILENGDLIYYFQELSLTLPASWRGKVMAEQDESGVSFYQISSHENYLKEGIKNGGFLFELGASVNHDFSKLPSFRYIGFCEESAMNYYLRLPTDYPAYNEEAIRAEYDEMLGQIDYVVENAKFYADQNKKEDDDDSTPAPAGAYEENASEGITSGLAGSDAVSEDKEAAEEDDSQNPSWTPQQVRYSFEHSMMPRYFYDRPDSVLGAIYHNGFYPLWKVVCEENNVNPTYPEKDYIVHWYTVDQKAELVQIELPDPDSATLCYRIYFVYGPDDDDVVYYTLESDDFAPDTTFLCTWDKDRNHEVLNTLDNLDKKDGGYADALKKEAEMIAQMAGISGELKLDPNAVSVTDTADTASTAGKSIDKSEGPDDDKDLQKIQCPQQGFSIKAKKDYPWDYQVGTGVTVYTGQEGSIPYVIVFQGEDLIVEAYEYIKEQYTPHMKEKYGDSLVSFEEKEDYEIGGKKLPAGIYTYKVGDYTVEQIRIYDSTGKATVAFTAKYIKGEGEDTLKALDTAVRTFEAQQSGDSFTDS